MDQHGKEYIRSDFSSILSIKALPPNVYFLHLFTSEGYSVTKKFIKI